MAIGPIEGKVHLDHGKSIVTRNQNVSHKQVSSYLELDFSFTKIYQIMTHP